MLRSFDYAAHIALRRQTDAGAVHRDRLSSVEAWLQFWQAWVHAAFLRSYLSVLGGSTLLPETPAEISALLNAYVLDKAVYEVGYELNNRPDWTYIPVRGILQLLETQ